MPDVSFQRDDCGRAIADGATIGERVYLGHNVVVYPGVRLDSDCIVMDGAVLGRLPIPNRTTTRPVQAEFRELSIGFGSTIGANAVLYTGTTIGADVLIGDLASIREGCRIGDGVVLGRGVMVLYDCSIGNFSRIQDQAHIVGNMTVEEHVFIGMGVITTNDNDIYRTRFGLAPARFRGPTVRRLAVIGAGTTMLEAVEIGTGAIVGAGSVVTRDVPQWTMVMGTPARSVRPIPQEWRTQVLRATMG